MGKIFRAHPRRLAFPLIWSRSFRQKTMIPAHRPGFCQTLELNSKSARIASPTLLASCNVVEIYAITGHTPGRVQAILTAHYLPRDGEVAANAIAKLNAYREAKKGNKFPTALPTALKIVGLGTEEAK